MKTLIMIVPKAQADDWPLKLLSKLGTPHTADPKRWSVKVGEDWMAVSSDDGVRDDYEPDELAQVAEMIGEARFYTLESHTEAAMSFYIQAIPDEFFTLIDNNHGWIAPAKEYKKAILMDADWLYTRVPPLPPS